MSRKRKDIGYGNATMPSVRLRIGECGPDWRRPPAEGAQIAFAPNVNPSSVSRENKRSGSPTATGRSNAKGPNAARSLRGMPQEACAQPRLQPGYRRAYRRVPEEGPAARGRRWRICLLWDVFCICPFDLSLWGTGKTSLFNRRQDMTSKRNQKQDMKFLYSRP